jgi:PHD/YefM family antitoxin component YafN of YafNO toxin-antitoxin module
MLRIIEVKSTFSVTEAQASLPRIIRGSSIVGISKHNKVAGFYIPRERFEALLETMELLANPGAMKTLKLAKTGQLKYRRLAQVEPELGL